MGGIVLPLLLAAPVLSEKVERWCYKCSTCGLCSFVEMVHSYTLNRNCSLFSSYCSITMARKEVATDGELWRGGVAALEAKVKKISFLMT